MQDPNRNLQRGPSAGTAMSGHVLSSQPASAWHLHNPELGGFESFTVVWVPGSLSLVGDRGDLVINHHVLTSPRAAVDWIARSVGSPEYLLSKSNLRKSFSLAASVDHLVSVMKEDAEHPEELDPRLTIRTIFDDAAFHTLPADVHDKNRKLRHSLSAGLIGRLEDELLTAFADEILIRPWTEVAEGKCPEFWSAFRDKLTDVFSDMDPGQIMRTVQEAGYQEFEPAETWTVADLAKIECLQTWVEKIMPRLQPRLDIVIEVRPAEGLDDTDIDPEDQPALGRWLVGINGLDRLDDPFDDPFDAAAEHAIGVFHFSIPVGDLDAVDISARLHDPAGIDGADANIGYLGAYEIGEPLRLNLTATESGMEAGVRKGGRSGERDDDPSP